MPKNSIVTKFCQLALGGPVIMPRQMAPLVGGGLCCPNSCSYYYCYVSYGCSRPKSGTDETLLLVLVLLVDHTQHVQLIVCIVVVSSV